MDGRIRSKQVYTCIHTCAAVLDYVCIVCNSVAMPQVKRGKFKLRGVLHMKLLKNAHGSSDVLSIKADYSSS